MKIKWREMTALDKVIIVLRTVLAFIVILLGFLQISGIMKGAINYEVPLLGVYLLILAFGEWKRDRDSAALNLILAVILFVVTSIVV